MAAEDLVPLYLKQIFDRAIPDATDANSPFNLFTAPIDGITLGDTVVATPHTGPFLYGVAGYAAATYKQ